MDGRKKLRPEHSIRMSGSGNPMFGKKRPCPALVAEKISLALKGRKKSVGWRNKISLALKGKPKSEIHKSKMRHDGNKGKKFTVEHKRKISEALVGREFSVEHRRKLQIHNSMETNPNWKGGLSFEPYSFEFNKKFKKRILQKFHHECVNCFSVGVLLHHVDYDKLNNKESNFVCLCRKCHTKTNYNRELWRQKFNDYVHEFETNLPILEATRSLTTTK